MNRRLGATAILAMLAACGGEVNREVSAQVEPIDASATADEVRRVWVAEDADIYFAASPSPDGRYVTELYRDTDLGVRDLVTGGLHRLTSQAGPDRNNGYAAATLFSADGNRIAYSWYDHTTDDYEVWTLDFVVEDGIPRGENPRRIAPASSGVAASYLFGWSGDDEILTGAWQPGGTFSLALLSVPSGSLRVLKSLDWRRPGAAISSDGRLVTYDYPVGDDPDDRDIHLIVDGSRESTVVERPGNDQVVGWLPGHDDLFFFSDHSGSPALWRLPMVDGEPTGAPTLVREDLWGFEALGFSRDAFYFTVNVDQPKYVTATLDPETGSLLRLPTVFEDPYGGRIRTLDWSPDGQHVVHDVVRPGSRGLTIVVRRADGEVMREWDFPQLDMTRVMIRWAPDGRSVVLNAFDDMDREAFHRIDLESGTAEVVWAFDEGSNQGRFALQPGSGHLYYAYGLWTGVPPTNHDYEIRAIDLGTHDERSVHTLSAGVQNFAFTPDGAWLAFFEGFPRSDPRTPPAIELISADGGQARVLHSVPEGSGGYGGLVGWTPDGGWLYFNRLLPDESDELWRVSLFGEAERVAAQSLRNGRLHPDGQTVTYRTGTTRTEIWVMEGLASGTASRDDAR